MGTGKWVTLELMLSQTNKTKKCNHHRPESFSYDGIPVLLCNLVGLDRGEKKKKKRERDENVPERCAIDDG